MRRPTGNNKTLCGHTRSLWDKTTPRKPLARCGEALWPELLWLQALSGNQKQRWAWLGNASNVATLILTINFTEYQKTALKFIKRIGKIKIDWLINWLIDWLIDWLTDWLMDGWTNWCWCGFVPNQYNTRFYHFLYKYFPSMEGS